MSPKTVLHLRSEQKPLEHRSALTPTTTDALIKSGRFEVHVERSPADPSRKRIYDDAEFEAVGATLVQDQSWTGAPTDHIIIGLKELDPETFPLKHTHVQFAHCYKTQAGWAGVLSRFPRGGGTLLDLEFLVDANRRRIAAFGYHAGFAGSALAIKTWAWQLEHGATPLPGVEKFTDGRGYYENEDQMLEQLRGELRAGTEKAGRAPRVFVMGALGRCGRGAVDLFLKAGLPTENILKWDMAETSGRPGPYHEIVESDIFVNCIYLSDPIPPFLNKETLEAPGRKLTVICDVSCDTTNPHNPIPVYSVNTTFTHPTVPVELDTEPPCSVISIDHLPSLLPRESSEAFSADLLPYLLQLDNWRQAEVWGRALELFEQKVATLPEGMAKRET
ncbi:saccharopine dehydrogenase [Trichodelitschia bisporula]|uniref:Saccharopine dehydrogenase [NAD(+), L-lysine-forming] n=1 Tax=Trichodelitschia bisporula TaxID=703511 RepID=A0A6G1I5K1_9PEZI|nr:saccharopine dehydrogenase [Trichodelitschia bisporula]